MSVSAIAHAAIAQSTAAQEISQTIAVMRGNAKEIVTAVTQQAKAAAEMAVDVNAVATGIGRIRKANAQQADAVETVTATLTALLTVEAGRPPRSVEPA
ncbi:MAG: hypothetical protein H7X95_05745 [Deltaproteobacteria bacterium]|nr:hypothetical protein [Deltaproteobacteria bacterium]